MSIDLELPESKCLKCRLRDAAIPSTRINTPGHNLQDGVLVNTFSQRRLIK